MDAFHVAAEFIVRVSVDLEARRLAGTHVRELGFLEVGDHPGLVRNQRQHRLANRHLLSGKHVLARYTAGARRADFAIRLLKLGLAQGSFGLLQLGLGGTHLSLLGGNLLRRGSRLTQAGAGLLDLLACGLRHGLDLIDLLTRDFILGQQVAVALRILGGA